MQGYTRRQLKEDRFAETAKEAASWASGHRRPVVWGIGVVVVAALVYAGVSYWLDRQSEQANIELGVAMRTLGEPLRPAGTPAGAEGDAGYTTLAERAKAAGKQFQSVADKYGYIKAGKIARYMQGVTTMQAGDNTLAEQQLKAVADSRNKDVAALAKMSLASLYRSTNRLADAARIYKNVEDHPTDTVSKSQAQLEMAAMYESTAPQEAATIYQQILKEDPKGEAAQIASSRLATIK
ncbi:MAG TPA: tetratricopeptide repeat protein [Candidatus Angelobacter sp.]|nr:tetratricopeptide repeat protein [Candidatus Angelobacter sp.]